MSWKGKGGGGVKGGQFTMKDLIPIAFLMTGQRVGASRKGVTCSIKPGGSGAERRLGKAIFGVTFAHGNPSSKKQGKFWWGRTTVVRDMLSL